MGSSYGAKKKWALQHGKKEHPLNLNQSHWKEVITLAATENDQDFFRKLGRLLTARPDHDLPSERKIQSFLLKHWAECADGLPELFYLSSPDLVRVCHRHLGTPDTTARSCDWMAQICKRLGLERFARRKMAEARLRAEKDDHGVLRFRRPDGWLYP